MARLPGNYVPGTGAKSELECEQGTWQDATEATTCKSATPGHYATRGSVFQTPCAPGHFNPHTSSPSAEYCELDAPGSYSGEAAADATSCEPGRFAAEWGSAALHPRGARELRRSRRGVE